MVTTARAAPDQNPESEAASLSPWGSEVQGFWMSCLSFPGGISGISGQGAE